MKALWSLALTLLIVGCAYSVHEVYVSDFRPYTRQKNGEMIKAQAEQFVVLGFAFDTNYIESAKHLLLQKCPEGDITGITTQISTDLGFFSWHNRVLMQGLCVRPAVSSAPKPSEEMLSL